MARYASESVINVPPEKVFAYVADLPRHSEWASHKLEVMQTSSGPVAAGSTFESVSHLFGTQREKLTVIDNSPRKRCAFESTGSLGLVLNAFELAAVDGGTMLTKSVEIERPSFMARLMAPMVGRTARKSLTADLAGIKKHLES
jgi:carbon monoxide dehydrogenase subunit G